MIILRNLERSCKFRPVARFNKDTCILPVEIFRNHLCIMLFLRFYAAGLFFLLRADPAVGCYSKMLRLNWESQSV